MIVEETLKNYKLIQLHSNQINLIVNFVAKEKCHQQQKLIKTLSDLKDSIVDKIPLTHLI